MFKTGKKRDSNEKYEYTLKYAYFLFHQPIEKNAGTTSSRCFWLIKCDWLAAALVILNLLIQILFVDEVEVACSTATPFPSHNIVTLKKKL